jgi:hypothetical protein
MNTQLEVHAKMTEDKQTIVWFNIYSLSKEVAEGLCMMDYNPPNTSNLVKGEFAIAMCGSLRPTLKQIKEQGIFIDTGKRFCHNHYWYEVWKLRPEHLTLIEKESNDGTPQGQH